MTRVHRLAAAVAALCTAAAGAGCGGGTPLGQIRITFHDTRIDGSEVVRIDMTVLQTELVDADGRRFVVSTEPHSFDLLQTTGNNPVVLAHAHVPPGVYSEIRLVLDPNAKITLADGNVEPLATPSGEASGIKIQGAFEIPAGRLYTLDIDMDPGRSVHRAQGTPGYVLRPVLEITGSEVTSGNFYYAGAYGGDSFVAALRADGSMSAKTALHPKYVVDGYYVHDGVARTLTVVPQSLSCPGCSRWEKLKMKVFADVPDARTFEVLSFGASDIDLRDPATGGHYPVYRVPSFDLSPGGQREVTVTAAIPDPAWEGKTILAQLSPEDGDGRVYAAVDTIPGSLAPSFDFSLPRDGFGGSVKDYILLMAIVPTQDDLTIRTDGTVAGIRNVIAQNAQAAVRLRITRDAPPAAVTVPFATVAP